MEDRYIRIKDAAKHWAIKGSSIYRLISLGKLPYKVIGGIKLVREEKLRQIFNKRSR